MMQGGADDRSCDHGASVNVVAGYADEPAVGPPAERWAPVGAACSSSDVVLPLSVAAEGREVYGMSLRPSALNVFGSWPPGAQLPSQSPSVDLDTVRRLEEEREQLDSSLLALTAHFAHVQLRLRQVASCPDPTLKDTLLKELEEFASNGVPDVSVLLPKPCESPFIGDFHHYPGPELKQANNGGSVPAAAMKAAAATAAVSAGTTTAADEKLRERQRAALEQLRSQLSELEAYAYEVGVADDVPTTTRVEKQSVIIEELQKKLHLSELENLATLSPEQLRAIVDAAIAEIVNPAKVKEKVVEQLKTQVTDLERFVQFLQTEIDSLPRPIPCGDCVCHRSPKMQAGTSGSSSRSGGDGNGGEMAAPQLVSRSVGIDKWKQSEKPASGRVDAGSMAAAAASRSDESVKSDGGHERRLSVLKRLLLVLQAFVISELGCGGGTDDSGLEKRHSSLSDNRWGNLRARMEMTVDDLLSLLNSQKDHWKGRARHGGTLAIALAADDDDNVSDVNDDDDVGNSDDNGDDEVFSSVRLSQDITQLVRKQLAPSLQQLLEHGLREESSASQGVVVWSFANCFSGRSRAAAAARPSDAPVSDATDRPRLHAWDIVMQYYELKRGREYTESPACKLSASFGLPVGDGRPTTVRQSLLRAVGDIVASHMPYRRSLDAHFKAFVCRALNEKKLISWLRLVVKSAVACDRYGQHSYVRNAGFEDALSSLDRLTQHSFNLPVDLAVSRLSSAADAF